MMDKEDNLVDVKTEMETIIVHDYSIASLIMRTLIHNGYEIKTKPIRNDRNFEVIAEEITVYSNARR